MTNQQPEHPTISFEDCSKLCSKSNLNLSYFLPAGCWTFYSKLVIIYDWQRNIPYGNIPLDDAIPLYTVDELTNFIEQRKIDILKAQEQTVNANLLDQIEQL